MTSTLPITSAADRRDEARSTAPRSSLSGSKPARRAACPRRPPPPPAVAPAYKPRPTPTRASSWHPAVMPTSAGLTPLLAASLAVERAPLDVDRRDLAADRAATPAPRRRDSRRSARRSVRRARAASTAGVCARGRTRPAAARVAEAQLRITASSLREGLRVLVDQLLDVALQAHDDLLPDRDVEVDVDRLVRRLDRNAAAEGRSDSAAAASNPDREWFEFLGSGLSHFGFGGWAGRR